MSSETPKRPKGNDEIGGNNEIDEIGGNDRIDEIDRNENENEDNENLNESTVVRSQLKNTESTWQLQDQSAVTSESG